MPLLSLGQAAKTVNVGKSTLSRAIKSGRISAERNSDGSYGIDPAELARAFPPVQSATVDVTGQVEALKEVATLLRTQLAEMTTQRDAWQAQAERLAIAPPTAVAPEPPPRPWTWAWLRSTG